jgi:flagellar hook-length control protein FliK
MALHPSTHAPAHSKAHATHATHAAQHAASKVKPSLSADEQGEGGGFAAQLLRAQPAAAKDAKDTKLADAAKTRTEAKKPADDHASKGDGDAADAKDKDAKTVDAKLPPAIDPNALMPWAQAIAPPTTSLADKPVVADDGAGDPLGALRKAAGKGTGKEALIASLGAGKEGAKEAKAADPLAAVTKGAPTRGDITAALAKADDAVKAATDARDSLAALLPQPDPVTVQAGAIGASPNAVQDPNQGIAQAAATPPAQAALPMLPQSPTFAPALGHQIDVWMKNGVQHAEVQLSPQDLGPIRVRIEMDGAQTRVHMTADVASTRDALQQAMPQLSDSLGLAGLSLSGGSVSDQPSFQSQQQAQANADGGFGGGRSSGATREIGGVDDTSAAAGIASAARQQAQRRGLLDMYA